MLAGILALITMATTTANPPAGKYIVTTTLVRTTKGQPAATIVLKSYYTVATRDSLGRPVGFAVLDSATADPASFNKMLIDSLRTKAFIAPLTGVNAMNFQANGFGGLSMYATFARMLFVAAPSATAEAWSDSTAGGTLLLAPNVQYVRTKWSPKSGGTGSTLDTDISVTISGEIPARGQSYPVVGSELGNGQYTFDANGVLTSARQSTKGSMSIGGQADIELAETIEIKRIS